MWMCVPPIEHHCVWRWSLERPASQELGLMYCRRLRRGGMQLNEENLDVYDIPAFGLELFGYSGSETLKVVLAHVCTHVHTHVYAHVAESPRYRPRPQCDVPPDRSAHRPSLQCTPTDGIFDGMFNTMCPRVAQYRQSLRRCPRACLAHACRCAGTPFDPLDELSPVVRGTCSTDRCVHV